MKILLCRRTQNERKSKWKWIEAEIENATTVLTVAGKEKKRLRTVRTEREDG